MGRDPPAPNTECANTYRFVGYGGTAPSPSLALLSVATAMASSHRDPRYARVALWGRGTRGPVRSTGGGPLYFYHGLLGQCRRPLASANSSIALCSSSVSSSGTETSTSTS